MQTNGDVAMLDRRQDMIGRGDGRRRQGDKSRE
jgi:hypothetical protein